MHTSLGSRMASSTFSPHVAASSQVTSRSSRKLRDLPREIIIKHLFPYLSHKSLARFACISREAYELVGSVSRALAREYAMERLVRKGRRRYPGGPLQIVDFWESEPLVACGTEHGVRICHNGELEVWSSHSSEMRFSVPSGSPGEGFVAVASGPGHCLARTNMDRVFGFGQNANGELGLGYVSDAISRPIEIEFFKKAGIRLVSMAAGEGFSLFLDRNGRTYLAGQGLEVDCQEIDLDERDLALPSPQVDSLESSAASSSSFPRSISSVSLLPRPSPMTSPTHASAAEKAFSAFFNDAVTTEPNPSARLNGPLFFAEDQDDQNRPLDHIETQLLPSLSLDATLANSASPRVLPELLPRVLERGDMEPEEKLIRVAAGLHHVLGTTNLGRVVAVGSNEYGQCAAASSFPDPVRRWASVGMPESNKGSRPVMISAGARHSLVLMSEGAGYSFGQSNQGELALPGYADSPFVPTRIPAKFDGRSSVPFVSLVAGHRHTLVQTCHDELLSCGNHTYGQLGSRRSFWSSCTLSLCQFTRERGVSRRRIDLTSSTFASVLRDDVSENSVETDEPAAPLFTIAHVAAGGAFSVVLERSLCGASRVRACGKRSACAGAGGKVFGSTAQAHVLEEFDVVPGTLVDSRA